MSSCTILCSALPGFEREAGRTKSITVLGETRTKKHDVINFDFVPDPPQ